MSPFTISTASQLSVEPPPYVALRNSCVHACRQFETAVRRLGEFAVHSLRESNGPTGGSGIRKASWSLSPISSSVPRARHLIRVQLTDWGADEQSEIAELLVSELVTNTLHHAWGPIQLALHLHDGTLHCEVQDANPALPSMRDVHKDDEGGRGLHLLDLLSQRWGSNLTSTGKVTWFELPTHADLDVSQQFDGAEFTAAQRAEDGPLRISLPPSESPGNPSS